MDSIVVRGARQHNLKNIDVEIPRGSLTVITGVSGSGKSSLAFDTLYAEGQRRYIESLSTYAKQFLERIGRPDVDDVTGLSPAIAIEQRNTTRSSRSTVGTATEIYDYLRLLFARVGRTMCPTDNVEVRRHTPDEVVQALLNEHAGRTFNVIAVRRVEKGGAAKHMEELIREGFARFLIKGEVTRFETPPRALGRVTTLDLVLDRVEVDAGKRARLLEAVETAYRMTDGHVRFDDVADGTILEFTSHLLCTICKREFEEPRPILFSFNTPFGACPQCRGFGNRMEFDDGLIVPDPSRSLRKHAIEPWSSEKFEYFYDNLVRFCRKKKIPMDTPWNELPAAARRLVMEGSGEFTGVLPFLENMREKTYKKYARFFTRRYLAHRECRACGGGRLRPEAYCVRLAERTIRDVASMTPADALAFVRGLDLNARERTVVKDVLIELESRLGFLLAVGLHYITLDRLARTLSGGESQRISLANSLGSSLLDVLYVLDEPSIGLHPRDTDRLVNVLADLRSRGNTVVVVEHDLDIIRSADHVIDMGPGAGEAGGRIVYEGPPNPEEGGSRTLEYARSGPPVRAARAGASRPDVFVTLRGVREHNLKNVDVAFPLGAFTSVTGVSGSGKSTLVCEVLHDALRGRGDAASRSWRGLDGARGVRGVLMVDQAPIGKTPRSNPVTYVKAFAEIREVFAAQRKAVKRGYKSGRFSFNVAGGRCARCQGMGWERVEMHFMADMFVRCSECDGRRFNRETLEITHQGRNLADVLELTVDDAIVHFSEHPGVVARLRVLQKVGLGYLRLGQPSTTLSGGESQRIKIARELSDNAEGGFVYILDEPTTGLHVDDVETLIDVLRELQAKGNTVIVVEHNLQVIAQSDWVVDLGPEGGDEGGEVVVAGTPAEVARSAASHTGKYLSQFLRGPKRRAS
ncbi:MAG TPA: excinuclease ABC subunit UvrA [Candidatus Krumholzibacteria bacterium]|nr:excinuclease ABC subunit UvrA [Candidatus Krumholzibacteria bacterium]